MAHTTNATLNQITVEQLDLAVITQYISTLGVAHQETKKSSIESKTTLKKIGLCVVIETTTWFQIHGVIHSTAASQMLALKHAAEYVQMAKLLAVTVSAKLTATSFVV